MKNCRDIKVSLTPEEQSPEVSLDNDTNEKENRGEDVIVTFVHGNILFQTTSKSCEIL
jgi:hypothetical protein